MCRALISETAQTGRVLESARHQTWLPQTDGFTIYSNELLYTLHKRLILRRARKTCHARLRGNDNFFVDPNPSSR